jgi:hypothetical protein
MDVLSARTFCPTDVLSLRTFCPQGRFVLTDVLFTDVLFTDVLSPDVLSTYVLSGHRFKFIILVPEKIGAYACKKT